MWWIKFFARSLQCFWQYLTRPKHIENEQACFTMVNFSISFKQLLPNLQSRPAEGSRCHRGPFMVLFWCLWYTSTFTIVAKIVFRFSRGLKRRTHHVLDIFQKGIKILVTITKKITYRFRYEKYTFWASICFFAQQYSLFGLEDMRKTS